MISRASLAGAALLVAIAAVPSCEDDPSTGPAACRRCVASIAAIRDNTIYDDEVWPGELSSGAGEHLFSGWTLENSPRGGHVSLERRALIQFEVRGFIEPGSTIDSVALYMTVTRSHPAAGPRWFELHRVTADWGEGASIPLGEGGGGSQAAPSDATWLCRFYPDSLWDTAGGDFAVAPSGGSLVDGPSLRFRWGSTPQMTSDVQWWLDEPDSNFGWIVIGETPSQPVVSPSTKRFASRENPALEARPTLKVYYTRP